MIYYVVMSFQLLKWFSFCSLENKNIWKLVSYSFILWKELIKYWSGVIYVCLDYVDTYINQNWIILEIILKWASYL